MNKLKISFLLPNLNSGGVEVVSLSIINELARQGYDVELILLEAVGDLLSRVSSKVKMKDLKCRKARYLFISLRKYLLKTKPDVIYTAKDGINIISVLVVKLFAQKTKIIISQHNYFFLEDRSNTLLKRNLFPFLIKLIYPMADQIISVSNGIKKFLVSWGIPEHKITTIFNPIDINRIRELAEVNVDGLPENYIVFVGRFSNVKNVPLIINAFSIVEKYEPSLKLVLVGDGPQYDNILKLISEKGIKKQVFCVGSTSNPYPYIKKSKLLLLSSFQEAFPLVILESMVLGKVIVSTPTKGPIELLNPDYKFFSKYFDDENEFARLIENALLLSDDVSRYKSEVIKYDLNTVVKQYCRVFYDVSNC
jgi:glycosyltransferase involved in cell wall biosynthesis